MVFKWSLVYQWWQMMSYWRLCDISWQYFVCSRDNSPDDYYSCVAVYRDTIMYSSFWIVYSAVVELLWVLTVRCSDVSVLATFGGTDYSVKLPYTITASNNNICDTVYLRVHIYHFNCYIIYYQNSHWSCQYLVVSHTHPATKCDLVYTKPTFCQRGIISWKLTNYKKTVLTSNLYNVVMCNTLPFLVPRIKN